MENFEVFTVQILNEESVVLYGAFTHYDQALSCFEKNKEKVGDRFHSESYGIAIFGWKNGEQFVLDEWQKPPIKRKFRVSGIFTEYIYAETEEEAIEQFDEISEGYATEEFDEIVCEEMPLSHEKI
jgi:hypothetical protein